jgi:hypothetical protein
VPATGDQVVFVEVEVGVAAGLIVSHVISPSVSQRCVKTKRS